jgi:hypothetical protein
MGVSPCRTATEVVGAAYGGRAGFTLLWEEGQDVPSGLPAGDFCLLVPKRPEAPLPVIRQEASLPVRGAAGGGEVHYGLKSSMGRGNGPEVSLPARVGGGGREHYGLTASMGRGAGGGDGGVELSRTLLSLHWFYQCSVPPAIWSRTNKQFTCV